jgi:hypothetical protein
MNLEQALKATKNGATAAFISGTLTVAVFLYAMSSNADGTVGLWNDPAILVDVIIIFACAFGLLRQSRFAAVTLCIYWVLAKAFILIETGHATGLAVGLIFLYFYAKAVQGTFAYHRIKKEEDPDYQAAPRWYSYVGIPALTIFLLATGYGLLTMTDYVPSTTVIDGNEVSAADRDILVSNGILYEDEEIVLFYSYGLVSVLEGGSILTDRAVISYFVDDDDQPLPYELTFDRIKDITLYEEGNYLNDALYKIDSYEEDSWFLVQLSTESRGDVRFIETLREKVKEAKAE